MNNEPNRAATAASENRVFERWLAEDLSAREFAELERRLKADELFRRRYLQYVDMEACLHEELATRPEWIAPPQRLSARSQPGRWSLAAMLAAGFAVVVLLSSGMTFDVPPERQRLVENAGPSGETRVREAGPRAVHVTAPLQGLPDVAVVTAHGLEAVPKLPLGARLKPGVLSLRDGDLQLDLLGGARVLLRGPAELHLVSATGATLVRGLAGVRMPFSPESFILSTPEAAVVGTWNEYGVQVDARGRTRVQNWAGMSEISLLGDDGSTLTSERLHGQEAVEVDASQRQFVALANTAEDWPRVLELDQAQLVVTDDYVREIEHSQPYLYWRFESLADGRIPDALGGPHAARIVSDAGDQGAIRIANGVAELLPSRFPRCIVSEQPIPQFNLDDFSIELWVMPTELKAGAIFSTVLPHESPVPLHLSFIEIAHNTHLVHKPGVVRFLHRQPPGQSGGFNLFSQEVCPPGVWTHVVATKTPSELRLFINGQLARSVIGPGTGASDDLSYRLVLGQLGTRTVERQFHGLIDEVAVYHRALRADEISRHYWSIRRDVPLAGRWTLGDNVEIALGNSR